MTVKSVVNRNAAVRVLRTNTLYDRADEWALGDVSDGTALQLKRALSPEIVGQVRFLSPTGAVKAPFFKEPGKLDNQATRGVRELTDDSASLLEAVLSVTGTNRGSILVTPAMLAGGR